jgi:hypothetical protein
MVISEDDVKRTILSLDKTFSEIENYQFN